MGKTSSMKIFLVQDGEASGPFDETEIRGRLMSGKISPETFATSKGLGEWKPVGEVLPQEGGLSGTSFESPPTLPDAINDPVREANIGQSVDLRDPHEDDPDVRRHTPEIEERIRSCAWLTVGLLYLLAFIWPTQLGDEKGIVNFHFEWANENLSWSVIPLMVWPGVAGLVISAVGFTFKGRSRGVLALLISMLPLLLVMIVGGDSFIKLMEILSGLEGIDLTQETGRKEAIDKSFIGLRGLIGVGATGLLFLIVLAGVLSTLYFTILLAPHAVRQLRPNSAKAYYLGLIGGIFLVLFQLIGLIVMLPVILLWVFFALVVLMGLVLQISSVIIGLTNTTERSPQLASKRALKALAFGAGGMLLIVLAPLLIEGEIGMYIFKLNIWFTAAALVFPLGVVDLWLGKASDTPQNS